MNLVTKIILFSFVILLTKQTLFAQTDKEQYAKFNAYLGKEQSTALNNAIKSMDKFFNKNFKEYSTENDKVEAFLVYLQKHEKFNLEWKLKTKKNFKVIDQFEKSELRKEIWLYGYEEDTSELDTEIFNFYNPPEDENTVYGILYASPEEEKSLTAEEIQISDSLEIYYNKKDSLKFYSMKVGNSYSKIPFAMNKFKIDNSVVNGYIEASQYAGDLSPEVLYIGFLEKKNNVASFSNYYFKVILVMNFYYYLMRWDLNNQGIYYYEQIE